MSTLQLSGLVSGFDWKSFVDDMIAFERTPATTMQSEIAANQLKLTSLSGIQARVGDLRAAVKALDSDGVFDSRSASASDSGWSAAASANTPAGSYAFNFVRRATASTWAGANNIGAPLAASADVSGLTLASLGTAIAPRSGEFTVNGKRVTVSLADSLAEVFARISSVTGGEVAAAYDPATDRVTLSGTGPVVLGSATDSSNLLSALRLANNGTGTVVSSAALGAASTSATLVNARLTTAITAVDGDGKGSFSLNGIGFDYNINTDTLASVIARINASAAGVTAAFDPLGDRVTLVNNATGDLGVALDEPAGGLLGALGLTPASGAALTRGLDAEFTVNGGPTLTSKSNTFDTTAHGVAGLSVTPDDTGAATITVGSNTALMRGRINTFISAFNSLQEYIESQTKVTSSNGKVSSATLGDNREVQNWGARLRFAVFDAVPGLKGAVARLDHLGIDFNGTNSTLVIKDSAKLDDALARKPDQVSAFFRQASTGFAARIEGLFSSYVGAFGDTGLLGGQRVNLVNRNTALNQQIAALDRRLEQRRAQLETGFIAMERAQATIKQMQSQLTNAFPTTSAKA
jgi:flagellar hook-associated protein 2